MCFMCADCIWTFFRFILLEKANLEQKPTEFAACLKWWHHTARGRRKYMSTRVCSDHKQSRVSVYLIICSANSSVRLLLNGPKGFWVWLLALWMWKPDFPLWFPVLLEQRSVWRCSAIRVSGLHLMSEPGGLSVSGREASSPLLSWVLLNARMRSIRDSGLQRL